MSKASYEKCCLTINQIGSLMKKKFISVYSVQDRLRASSVDKYL
jgi:hypothetical protein